MNRSPFHVPLFLLWIFDLLGTVVSVAVGVRIQPIRYDAARSSHTDPMEATVEEAQNHIVADALNRGRIRYPPNGAPLVSSRSAAWLFVVDLVRMFLASALPILLIGGLIRKTCAARRI